MPREVVLTAAKERFARDGYDKTTLRAIAGDAAVDPSMVLYLFGSKADLFRESLRLVVDPKPLVAAMTEGDGTVGERLVRQYLDIWESPETAPTMVATLASATSNPDAKEAFRSFLRDYVLTTVAAVIGGDEEARLRAQLVATSLIGTSLMRYVIPVPPLADMPTEDVVKIVAPTVTRYLACGAKELGLPS